MHAYMYAADGGKGRQNDYPDPQLKIERQFRSEMKREMQYKSDCLAELFDTIGKKYPKEVVV